MTKRLNILLILLFLSPAYQKNFSLKAVNSENIRLSSEHYLVKWKAWQALSLLGCIGTPANLLIMYTFYSVPNMATSVNAMIFMEILYQAVYSIVIHWRTYTMVQDATVLSRWFTREQVTIPFCQVICQVHSSK